jgi:hypothetical protein
LPTLFSNSNSYAAAARRRPGPWSRSKSMARIGPSTRSLARNRSGRHPRNRSGSGASGIGKHNNARKRQLRSQGNRRISHEGSEHSGFRRVLRYTSKTTCTCAPPARNCRLVKPPQKHFEPTELFPRAFSVPKPTERRDRFARLSREVTRTRGAMGFESDFGLEVVVLIGVARRVHQIMQRRWQRIHRNEDDIREHGPISLGLSAQTPLVSGHSGNSLIDFVKTGGLYASIGPASNKYGSVDAIDTVHRSMCYATIPVRLTRQTSETTT